MKDWERLRKDISAWGKETFGGPNHVRGASHHLVEEAKELCSAVELGLNKEETGEEIADVLVLALNIADLLEIDPFDVTKAKFEKLKSREWLPPDENGVVRHKK